MSCSKVRPDQDFLDIPTENVELNTSTLKQTRESKDLLQKQVMMNQKILMGINKKKPHRPSSLNDRSKAHINKIHDSKRSLSHMRQPKSGTMKMSSSGQNFPQTGLTRAQHSDTQPMGSLKKLQKHRPSSKTKDQINPSEFKKVLINEVNELK
jgi:hypothetical protein